MLPHVLRTAARSPFSAARPNLVTAPWKGQLRANHSPQWRPVSVLDEYVAACRNRGVGDGQLTPAQMGRERGSADQPPAADGVRSVVDGVTADQFGQLRADGTADKVRASASLAGVARRGRGTADHCACDQDRT